jgi:hypothetical protein
VAFSCQEQVTNCLHETTRVHNIDLDARGVEGHLTMPSSAASRFVSTSTAPLGRCESAIRWAVYPSCWGALALLWALLAGASLAWAPYIAVAIAGPLVILAERSLPYRQEWQAS